jgi:hypothetical protein
MSKFSLASFCFLLNYFPFHKRQLTHSVILSKRSASKNCNLPYSLPTLSASKAKTGRTALRLLPYNFSLLPFIRLTTPDNIANPPPARSGRINIEILKISPTRRVGLFIIHARFRLRY